VSASNLLLTPFASPSSIVHSGVTPLDPVAGEDESGRVAAGGRRRKLSIDAAIECASRANRKSNRFLEDCQVQTWSSELNSESQAVNAGPEWCTGNRAANAWVRPAMTQLIYGVFCLSPLVVVCFFSSTLLSLFPTPLMELHEPLAGPYDLRIAHARVIPDPQRVCSWEWLRHQLYTINWTNVALILTVVAVSAHINAQLNEQRVEMSKTNEALDKLRTLQAEVQLTQSWIVPALQRLETFNATLEWAVRSGLPNLTQTAQQLQDMQRINYAVTTGHTNPNQPVPIFPGHDGWSLFDSHIVFPLPFPGVWRVEGWMDIRNSDLGAQALCAGIGMDPNPIPLTSACTSVITVDNVRGLMSSPAPPLLFRACDSTAVAQARLFWGRAGTQNVFGYGWLNATLMKLC
jgi:hypothetical protein